MSSQSNNSRYRSPRSDISRKSHVFLQTLEECIVSRNCDPEQLRKSVISGKAEQIFSNPSAYIIKFREKIDHEIATLSGDIDKFITELVVLFEEVKRLLISLFTKNAMAFEEYLAFFCAQINSLVQDAQSTIHQQQDRDKYKALLEYDEFDAEREDIKLFREKRKQTEIVEDLYYKIKNLKQELKIDELSDNVISLIGSSTSFYRKKYLKQCIHNIKVEITNNLENDQLFEWDRVVSRFKLKHDPNELYSDPHPTSGSKVDDSDIDSIFGSMRDPEEAVKPRARLEIEKIEKIISPKKNKDQEDSEVGVDFNERSISAKNLELMKKSSKIKKPVSGPKEEVYIQYQQNSPQIAKEKGLPKQEGLVKKIQEYSPVTQMRDTEVKRRESPPRSVQSSSTWGFIKSIYNGIMPDSPKKEIVEVREKVKPSTSPASRKTEKMPQQIAGNKSKEAMRARLEQLKRETKELIANSQMLSNSFSMAAP